MNYLTVSEVLAIHQVVIDEFGGSYGVRDMGALEAALFRPQTGYYEDLTQEAAALMESLAMNHPFIDGNKRMAFFVADTFLRLNGYAIACDNKVSYRHFMALFDQGQFDYAHLQDWLRQHVCSNA